MKPLWVIQENLNNDDQELLPILDRLQIPYKMIQIIPFSDSIPDVEYDGPIIARGSTTTLRGTEKKSWKPGVWHNDNFKPSVYLENYKHLYLNREGVVCPLNRTGFHKWDSEHMFVRPNSDYKEFTGGMMTEREIGKIAHGAALKQYPFGPDLELFVAPGLTIMDEARFIVAGGKVISGTFYRFDRSLKREKPATQDFTDFAVKCASLWGPADVYALDIGRTKQNEYGVIECNCFNASGLYGDVERVVREVTDFVEMSYGK